MQRKIYRGTSDKAHAKEICSHHTDDTFQSLKSSKNKLLNKVERGKRKKKEKQKNTKITISEIHVWIKNSVNLLTFLT